MGGTDTHPHRQFAYGQFADSMHATRVNHGEFLQRFLQDPFTFLLSKRGVSLVAQPVHGTTVVVVPHPSFEADKGTGSGVQQYFTQWRQHYWRIGKLE